MVVYERFVCGSGHAKPAWGLTGLRQVIVWNSPLKLAAIAGRTNLQRLAAPLLSNQKVYFHIVLWPVNYYGSFSDRQLLLKLDRLKHFF